MTIYCLFELSVIIIIYSTFIAIYSTFIAIFPSYFKKEV